MLILTIRDFINSIVFTTCDDSGSDFWYIVQFGF